jgi:hypothetical protein
VVGEQQVVGGELADGGEEGGEARRIVDIGASLPVALYTCASAEPPRRLRPAPRSISSRSVSPASSTSCGVSVRRASLHRARSR